jgi:hypothetical protein
MSKFVSTDYSVTVNSVDLSDHVQSVAFDVNSTEVDVTCMGDVWDQMVGGRKRASGSVTFYQDFASSSVDDTVNALVGTTTTLVFLPTSSAVGATNPEYTITGALITGYNPVAGTYGDAAMTVMTWTGGTLARATS